MWPYYLDTGWTALPQDVGVREDRKRVTILPITTVAIRPKPLTLSSRNLYPRSANEELILLLSIGFPRRQCKAYYFTDKHEITAGYGS